MATTTNYSWTTPDDSDPFRNGASAIRTLGSSVDTTLFTALGGTYPGLRLVKKQTIGSAVSSLVVSDAFNATYQNYKIIIAGGTASTSGSAMQLTLGGIPTGYYTTLCYQPWGGTGGPFAVNQYNLGFWNWAGNAGADNIFMDCDLSNPFASKVKGGSAVYTEQAVGGSAGTARFYNTSTASATSFTLTPSGTLTGGTVYVYGYGTS
jgi:hypothetical protein